MKTLIFDFGNVIAFFDHLKACRQLASLAKDEVTEDSVYQAVFGTSLEPDFDCGKISPAEFVQQLRTLFHIMAPDEAIIEAWCDMFWPNGHVISLLPRLKESAAKLILASNTNELHYKWFTMRFAEPLALFDGFILSYKIGFRKPSIEFFEKCLEAANAQTGDCVYIDDRSDFVDVARVMGMAGIVYTPHLNLAAALRNEGVAIV